MCSSECHREHPENIPRASPKCHACTIIRVTTITTNDLGTPAAGPPGPPSTLLRARKSLPTITPAPPAITLTPPCFPAKIAPMASLISTVYKKTFWNTYDHIGRLILLNLLWTAFFPLPTYLTFWLIPAGGHVKIAATVLVGILTHSLATTGVFAATADIVDYRKFTLKRFLSGGREAYLRALVISLLAGLVFYLTYISMIFYLALEGTAGILGFFLAGVQVWIMLFVIAMCLYLLPLLTKKNWGIFKTIKWSAVLVVLKPGFSLLIMLQVLAASVIIGITIIGAIVILMSLVSVFLGTNLREVLKELEAEGEPKKRPTSWKEIFGEERKREEEPRGIKDILRPWDN